jgi:carbon monoxide dehydrogenase subunit G
MELTNSFQVNVPVDDAWAILTDVERIAPCMPGADLQEVEGDENRGVVKVKVGPITAQYKGAARFIEKDDAGHVAVLKAEGRDTRGAGNASATITATLTESAGGTNVKVDTDLTVSGKVAQFGRGVLADVSARLMKEFADRLAQDLSTVAVSAADPSEPAAVETAPPPRPEASLAAPVAPVDLVATAGAPLAKRAAPLVAALFVLYWLTRRRRRRRKATA